MLNLIAYNLIRIPKLLTASRQQLTTSRSPHEFEDKKTEKALLSTFFSGLLGLLCRFFSAWARQDPPRLVPAGKSVYQARQQQDGDRVVVRIRAQSLPGAS